MFVSIFLCNTWKIFSESSFVGQKLMSSCVWMRNGEKKHEWERNSCEMRTIQNNPNRNSRFIVCSKKFVVFFYVCFVFVSKWYCVRLLAFSCSSFPKVKHAQKNTQLETHFIQAASAIRNNSLSSSLTIYGIFKSSLISMFSDARHYSGSQDLSNELQLFEIGQD